MEPSAPVAPVPAGYPSIELARHAAAMARAPIPDDVKQLARLCLLDTLGVILAAVKYGRRFGIELIDRYLSLLPPSGGARSSVVGRTSTVTPDVAAFANGCLVEFLDWQDTTMISRVHCSSSVVPAALAIGESEDATGAQVLRAVVAGYEVACRVGQAVHPSHWRRGYQSTGTLNTFGAAAAAALIWEVDAATMADAIAIAGHILPMSTGDGIFCGYSSKILHGGQAAAVGIQAARLARAGFAAGPIEGMPPRHAAFLPMTSDDPEPLRMVEGFGDRWLLRDVWHKPYPTGLLNIAPAEAAIRLATDHDLAAASIEHVTVSTYRDGVTFVGRHTTSVDSSLADVQLSLPYAVAVGLSDRSLGVEQVTPERIADPGVHELARRIEVVADPALEVLYPERLPAVVTVRTTSGVALAESVTDALGSPARRMPEASLIDKFQGNAAGVLERDAADDVVALVLGLDSLDSIRPLLRLLRASA